MKKGNEEFSNFDRTMRKLMKVSHDEIKAKLEAEKAEKDKTTKPVRLVSVLAESFLTTEGRAQARKLLARNRRKLR